MQQGTFLSFVREHCGSIISINLHESRHWNKAVFRSPGGGEDDLFSEHSSRKGEATTALLAEGAITHAGDRREPQ
jgi:hypothetical protein